MKTSSLRKFNQKHGEGHFVLAKMTKNSIKTGKEMLTGMWRNWKCHALRWKCQMVQPLWRTAGQFQRKS
jgi:hypothetical protein